MNSDVSDDVIPDSQESTTVNFEVTHLSNTPATSDTTTPFDNELHSGGKSTDELLTNNTNLTTSPHESIQANNNNITEITNNPPGSNILFDTNAYAPQRSLRKRTAIQRMPYSLERIKHRQLLEGYDVSSFDTVSNHVDTSALEKRNKSDTTLAPTKNTMPQNSNIMNYEDELFDYNMEIPSEDSDFSFEEDNHDIGVRNQNDEHNDDITLLSSSIVPETKNTSDTDSDDILFRGKRLKVKTGYRGILPKMVWERQFSSVGIKSRPVKRKPKLQDRKGVALKKKTKTTTTQDNSLLNELISDDNASDDSDEFDIYHQAQNTEVQDTPALAELDKYYHEKYDNNYLSDTSFTKVTDNSTLAKGNKTEPYQRSSLSDIDNELIYVDSDENTNSDILEDNSGGFDPLLSSIRRSGLSKISNYERHFHREDNQPLNRKKKVTNYKKPNSIKRMSIKSYRHPRIRASNIKNVSKNIPYPTDPLSTHNAKHNKNVNEIEKEEKKRERKKNHYSSNRNSTTYNTVVEALSRKFGSTSHKNSTLTREQDISNDFTIIPESPTLDILDVFFKKTSLTPPDTVSITLNNEIYILSRFNTNEFEDIVRKILNRIISEGCSEEELFDIFKKITNILWRLNIPSICAIIEDFHFTFREKLNSLRQNAKPIHFYILAVCQLMLLEVSKYSNVALVNKEKIGKMILNHIASFFSILSVCYDKINKGNTDVLNQSYDILATIIDELNEKEELWNILNEKSFIPDVVRLLCNIFPTRKPQWEVIKFEGNFTDIRKTLSLIHYCYFRLKWEVPNSVILKLHEVFKIRRFCDFKEEKSLSQRNKARTNPDTIYSCKTTFNGYLLLLSYMEISNSLLEKLTPISRIISEDTSSALVNRFNLLILLAYKSKLNYENRFELILNQLGELNFTTTNISEADNKQVCQAVLNTIIFFLRNNCQKQIPMKCNVVSMAYMNIIRTSPIKSQLWSIFLIKSRQVVSNYKNIWPRFNKALYKCFVAFNDEIDDRHMFSLYLDIYMDNLRATSSKWLQANLFPFLKRKSEVSIEYVDYYCQIGEYLIKNGDLSWWQLLTFNKFDDSDEDTRYYFNSKIIDLCDPISFSNIEIDFYTLIVTKIETSIDNEKFWQFCVKLLQKTTKIKNDNVITMIMRERNMINYVPFWKRLFKNLGDLKFKDLIKTLMDKISNLYGNGKIDHSCMRAIMVYLDSNFFEDLQDIRCFNYLREVFNISNKEMENNEFKKTIGQLPSIMDQILHIEHAIIVADYDEVIERKLLSLFLSGSTNHVNVYKIIVMAIMSTGGQHHDNISMELFKMKLQMCNFLLGIMIKANLSKFYQLNKDEYFESIQLVQFICLSYRFDEVATMKSKIYSKFMNTCASFILQLFNISIGYDESYIISKYLEYNASCMGVIKSKRIVSEELVTKIEKLLDENGAVVNDDTYPNASEQNTKFEKFIELLQEHI